MRRILSFILIICLLHTQNCHAAAIVIDPPSSSLLEKGTVNGAFGQSAIMEQNEDLNQVQWDAETTNVNSMIMSSDLMTLLKQPLAVLKEGIAAFNDTFIGIVTTGLCSVAAIMFVLVHFLVSALSSWFDDVPFYVASRQFTHLWLSEFQPLDVCPNFLGDIKDLKRTRRFSHYDHASAYQGGCR